MEAEELSYLLHHPEINLSRFQARGNHECSNCRNTGQWTRRCGNCQEKVNTYKHTRTCAVQCHPSLTCNQSPFYVPSSFTARPRVSAAIGGKSTGWCASTSRFRSREPRMMTTPMMMRRATLRRCSPRRRGYLDLRAALSMGAPRDSLRG